MSPDRVIRTVTGLRPFRPAGFVVRQESIGSKTVIHNYGHGGGGMTLSWGTADQAVELVQKIAPKKAAVLGCGGVGLATARLLQRRGVAVTIYAKDLPPETTSNISGAQWWPTSVFDRSDATPAFEAQFLDAARRSYRHFQTMIGDTYGIRWVPNYNLTDDPPRNSLILGLDSPIRELQPEFRDLARNEHPFDAPYARQFDTMMIEPPIYLTALLRDFFIAGGQIVVRTFGNISEIESLSEPVVVNCTGLGSRQLLSDNTMVPIKGQLTVLLPQAEVDYNVLKGGLYMFPRRDGILLGGTFQRGEWSLDVDREEQTRILAGHAELFQKVRERWRP